MRELNPKILDNQVELFIRSGSVTDGDNNVIMNSSSHRPPRGRWRRWDHPRPSHHPNASFHPSATRNSEEGTRGRRVCLAAGQVRSETCSKVCSSPGLPRRRAHPYSLCPKQRAGVQASPEDPLTPLPQSVHNEFRNLLNSFPPCYHHHLPHHLRPLSLTDYDSDGRRVGYFGDWDTVSLSPFSLDFGGLPVPDPGVPPSDVGGLSSRDCPAVACLPAPEAPCYRSRQRQRRRRLADWAGVAGGCVFGHGSLRLSRAGL